MRARAVQHEFGDEVSTAVGLPLWFKRIQMILDEQDGEDQGDSNQHAKSKAHRCARPIRRVLLLESPIVGAASQKRRRTAIHPSTVLSHRPLRADQHRFKRASLSNFWVCPVSTCQDSKFKTSSAPLATTMGRLTGRLLKFSNAHRSRTVDQ